MSRNTSGFHWTHLFSSLEVVVTMSWNDRSPVFSLTQVMPLGEKSEYPEDEPDDQRRTRQWDRFTNVAGVAVVVCYKRAHCLREGFDLVFPAAISCRFGRL